MRITKSAAAGLLLMATAVCGGAEPASNSQTDRLTALTEKAAELRTKAQERAKERLLSRLDDEIVAARRRPAKAELKVQLIETLTREKTTLAKSGFLPFSPAARRLARDYVKELHAADQPVSAVYDNLIAFAVKSRDDAAAADFTERKRKALAPIRLGSWNMRMANSAWKARWTFWSDGTSNGADEAPRRRRPTAGRRAAGRSRGRTSCCDASATGRGRRKAGSTPASSRPTACTWTRRINAATASSANSIFRSKPDGRSQAGSQG